MNKKIIAAAVAATMTSVAFADIAITGGMQVNYTHTDYDSTETDDSDVFKHEANLNITGKSGDTTVVMNLGGGSFDNTSNANGGLSGSGTNQVNVEDLYMSTKVGDVSIKAGKWDNGDNELRTSARGQGKFSASTSVAGIDLTYNSANVAGDSIVAATSLQGVDLSFEQTETGETIKVATEVGGVKFKYLGLPVDAANSDRAYYEVSGTVAGVGVKYGKAETETGDAIDGNSWMGDFEGASGAYALSAGQDVESIELSTSLAGNSVKFRNTSIDDKANEDTSFNKIIVTRPLASGTTFELTYTDLTDDGSTSTDSTSLDLELSVKF